MLILSIVIFLLILSFLVIIHEAGHFFAARKFGMKVEEFGLGYPPRARKLFTWKDTLFSLNWFPFGGFVKIAGEDRIIDEEAKQTNGSSKYTQAEHYFFNKPWWQRIIVLLAGATINFLFGVIAFSIIYTHLGIPQPIPLDNGIFVSAITVDSPAEKAGIIPGDEIQQISVNETVQPVESVDGFIDTVKAQAGQTVTFTLLREGELQSADVYIRLPDEIPEGDGAVGVQISNEKIEYVQYPFWQMPFRGAWTGIQAAVDFGLLILAALGTMVGDAFSGIIPQDVSGPIGIVREFQKAEVIEQGWMAVFNFAAILSINLAIVNVLPIPALDGGRVLFVFIEKLIGKRINPKYENYANAIGFAALLLMIFLISIRDVTRIISDIQGGA